MGKGNKPQKNDKANKKPKGAKKLGVSKKPSGMSIFGDSQTSM